MYEKVCFFLQKVTHDSDWCSLFVVVLHWTLYLFLNLETFLAQGPFEIFSVGGDLSEANVVKFSNDGRLMLLTTMGGHIHVLDSFRGTLVRFQLSFLLSSHGFFHTYGKLVMWLFLWSITLQLSTYSVKPVAQESTLDATFSPEGMFVVSGNLESTWFGWCMHRHLLHVKGNSF